ncbi:MAG: hypothetical protein NTY36_01375 [Deltaproteobacteria bacterium]|nr:hypothetical protein [Deltaproteobacteria bacterium]
MTHYIWIISQIRASNLGIWKMQDYVLAVGRAFSDRQYYTRVWPVLWFDWSW